MSSPKDLGKTSPPRPVNVTLLRKRVFCGCDPEKDHGMITGQDHSGFREGPKSKNGCPYKTQEGKSRRRRDREHGHMKMKAETGVALTQAKTTRGHQKPEEISKDSS